MSKLFNYILKDFVESLRVNGFKKTFLISLSSLKDSDFDEKYQVDTGKHNLIKGALGAGDVMYAPTRSEPLRKLLSLLPVNRSLQFVDLGAGLGRAMIIAAECGFTKVSGIEVEEDIYQQCHDNLEKVKSIFPKAQFDLKKDSFLNLDLPLQDCLYFCYASHEMGDLKEFFQKLQKQSHNCTVIYHFNLWSTKKALEFFSWASSLETYQIDGNTFYLAKF